MKTLRSLTADREDSLNRWLKWSFGGHFFFFAAVLIKTQFFPGHPTPYIPALKVDLVGLPDTLKKDLKSPDQLQFQKEIVKVLKEAEKEAQRIKEASAKSSKDSLDPDEMGMKKKNSQDATQRSQSNLAKLKNFQRQNRISESLKKVSSLVSRPNFGNLLSAGASSVGKESKEAQATYSDLIANRLQSNWEVPAWLQSKKLKADIRFYIDANGGLIRFRMELSSGSEQFDEAALQTIQKSVPFPIPPEAVAAEVMNEGIAFSFPSKSGITEAQ